MTASHGFKEVLVFLETIHADKVITAQNSPVKHRCTFHFKTENTNPLCYKLNLEFRIHISYKEYQKRIRTITKTIMVQDIGQFGWNSFKRLLTNCWKLIALRSPKIKISSYSCDAKDIRCRAKKKVTGCFQSKQHFTELIFCKRMTVILRKGCTKYVADKALVYHEITTNVYKLDNIVHYPNQRPTKTRKQP